jgi:hypothetical protein
MKIQFSLFFIFLVNSVYAQTITWDGGAGDGKWHSPSNWDNDQLPCNTCIAYISNVTVNFSTIDTVAQVVLEPGSFLNILVNSKLNVLNGGALSANNSLINNYGEIYCKDYSNNGVSISNNGVFNNYTSIQILGTNTVSTESGIHVYEGGFFNQAGSSIHISDQSSSNIYVNALGSFQNSGAIFMANSDGEGISNYGTFDNLSAGTMNMSFVRYFGIKNDHIFRNYGEINISDIIPSPTSLQDGLGFNNTGTFLNASGAQFSIFNAVGVGLNTESDFTNAGTITIDGITPDNNNNCIGFRPRGDFSNSGELNILNSAQEGVLVENYSPGVKQNNGLIEILNSGTVGLTIKRKFINGGDILIDQTGGKGMMVYDTLLNSGAIQAENTILDAIYAYIGGVIENLESGSLNANHSGAKGITLLGGSKLNNAGFIRIDSTADVGIFNYLNSQFNLTPDAIIIINHTAGHGFQNWGNFSNNDGSISIINFIASNANADGFVNSGTFYNNGAINIGNAPRYGFYNGSLPTTSFQNDYNLQIANSGLHGFYSTKNFTNNGSISLIECTSGLYIGSAAQFTNLGTLKVKISQGNLIDNNGTIENHSNIILGNSTTFGIVQSSNAILNNLATGTISIDTVTNSAIDNFGIVNNHGKIDISKVNFAGLNNQKLLNNHGQLNFKNCNKTLQNDGEFETVLIQNFLPGIINFNEGAKLFENRRSFTNEGTLNFNAVSSLCLSFMESGYTIPNADGDTIINSGTINMGPSMHSILTDYADLTQNLFLNTSTGIINTNGSVLNEGKFINQGVISQKSGMIPNVITEAFHNEGVFVDMPDLQNSNANFINTGLLLKPLKGEISVGIKELNLVQRTGSTTFSPGNTWYINPFSTVTGGTFSAADDSFLPNANSPYADSLYFNVVNNSITRAVKLPILKTPSCSVNPTATFTQAVSTDWHTAENWNSGLVPDYCTTAIIPNTKKCSITTGRKARAFKILSDTGSVFDAELGVVLEVEN